MLKQQQPLPCLPHHSRLLQQVTVEVQLSCQRFSVVQVEGVLVGAQRQLRLRPPLRLLPPRL